jgi:mono/diheme cytochrome c family protein
MTSALARPSRPHLVRHRSRLGGICLGAIVVAGLLCLAPASPAAALDGAALAAENCAACHTLTGPAPATFQGVLERKAPDLFYAGSKFNRPWLVEWLQAPAIIRRSGVMFLNNIVNEDRKDRIGEASVAPCPVRLGAGQAEAVADYLMTLKDPAMAVGVVDLGQDIKARKAFRMFTKQLPCIGCHRIKFRKKEMGGISGPDLTTAGARLNPDWIYARIENPQYWDPKTWMPRIEMSHRKREMLTLFLASMK